MMTKEDRRLKGPLGKIIFFCVNGSQPGPIKDKDLLISVRNVGLKGKS